MEQNTQEQMDAIANLLDIAEESDMEIEVIYYALVYMKSNPSVTPYEAFQLGFLEWMK